MGLDIRTVALHGVDDVRVLQHVQRLVNRGAADVVAAAQTFLAGQRLVLNILSALDVVQQFLINGNVKRIARHRKAPFRFLRIF